MGLERFFSGRNRRHFVISLTQEVAQEPRIELESSTTSVRKGTITSPKV